MSKLNKKNIIVLILILIGALSVMYLGLYRQNQKDIIDTAECKNSPFVAKKYFKISVYQYTLKELINLQVNIIRKGKIIKTFNKEDNKEDYFSFEYDNLMKSDSIEVNIKNDVYYIHSFENDYWLKCKPYQCYLSVYKINNTTISGPQQEGFFLKKEDLN
jgi:hypothetical protein